jgi:NAD-dependent SIR2 family protein deacetylase
MSEAEVIERIDGEAREVHGFRGDPTWMFPRLAVKCDEIARNKEKANEYLDEPDVLEKKIKLLAELIRSSKNCIAYTGAGISTAAGMKDWASKAGAASVVRDPTSKTGGFQVKNTMDYEPTLTHAALGHMWKAGHLKYWIQQNHDGLSQKAGLPQMYINEIHGAWFDPSNPPVKMWESCRHDLSEAVDKWAAKTDLCIAAGTSLSGLNADRCAVSVGRRSKSKGKEKDENIGLVIITLQKTQVDKTGCLRIFAKVDDVFGPLAAELGLNLNEEISPSLEMKNEVEDVFQVQIGPDGYPLPDGQTATLDLRKGSYFKLTVGDFEGCYGIVGNKTKQGHYRMLVLGNLNEKTETEGKMFPRTLGKWWIRGAMIGQGVVEGGKFPVVSIVEAEVPEESRRKLFNEATERHLLEN